MKSVTRLVPLAFLCACAAARPRPLEVESDWAGDMDIYVLNAQSNVNALLLKLSGPVGGTLLVAPEELASASRSCVRETRCTRTGRTP